ncbi:conserved membrane hypothetical protein [Thermococcus barophilus]|uniref:Uncharacterized protein n=1 Tax=Thermococcus barophilus TaxID=55802 RepID=A0A0S1X9B3_THEBA|nr:conserved membrane hypothetical protein [Thermococcus barophilus]
MICPIIREVVEITIGFAVMSLFFSRRFPILYKSPAALIIGSFFLVEPIVDIALGTDSTVFEFLGSLLLLLVVEKFIAANENTSLNVYSVITGALVGVVAFLATARIPYVHIGTMVTLALLAFRMGNMVEKVGWGHREVFGISSLFLFAGALAFAIGMKLLSSFLYFGGVLLFMLAVLEVR